ncbi:hypothetical protein GGS23DRAFT_544466 [Durotheca rogersii]|uniref:uncharacterized protein n=1 Tax=Durotheca rogersii TaxID=419775 RepID=UPI0022208B27|nr:uncharacterized protein GGS23DRAFT_544466 [Durotheca rogersii]KAI5868192.1 hypothetical protein GGS23DRAFT_544466 [Durotheca rogersii]
MSTDNDSDGGFLPDLSANSTYSQFVGMLQADRHLQPPPRGGYDIVQHSPGGIPPVIRDSLCEGLYVDFLPAPRAGGAHDDDDNDDDDNEDNDNDDDDDDDRTGNRVIIRLDFADPVRHPAGGDLYSSAAVAARVFDGWPWDLYLRPSQQPLLVPARLVVRPVARAAAAVASFRLPVAPGTTLGALVRVLADSSMGWFSFVRDAEGARRGNRDFM